MRFSDFCRFYHFQNFSATNRIFRSRTQFSQLNPENVDGRNKRNKGIRPIRHRDFSMYNNCFFENWYQRSRDRGFPLIVQFFDFVKGFKERSTAKKVQDPVLSYFENSKWISREISGLYIICIFCSLRFSVISP